ncbi:MAG: helix-turn-helix domain-containing protein [Oscillospiraceae bacterium]|nr:helix-turn-helix domain-containing protein [Oscillospiraceae bacterium]
MAIGERIHFFRKKKGMKLKQLGQAVGFPESNADVRMAQYESGSRTPKADITNRLAEALDVSPQALTVPDIDSYTGLMHTLFTLEDIYGLRVTEIEGEIVLHVDVRQGRDAAKLHQRLCAWWGQAAKLETGKISREDYDRWRYHYPELDTTQVWAGVVPQGLSDTFMDNLHDDE